MITIIITVLLGIGISIYILKSDENSVFEIEDYIFYGFLSGVIGMLIGLIIAICIPAETELEVKTYQIETLQDNYSASGSFVLGSGQIDGQMKYIFYYNEAGFIKMKQLNYEDVIIKYSESEPKIEEQIQVMTDATINSFAIINADPKFCFYIPKGSIKQIFNLDAH